MYGLTPNPARATTASLQLTPIMRLEADLISVKRIPAGHPVSYGGTWVAPRDTYIGIMPLGYADGIDRHASGKIWVAANGQKYPQVGRICMDQFMVDLGNTPDGQPPLKPGETVRLWGDGSQGEPTADDWAGAADTINYTIVTALNSRGAANLYLGGSVPFTIRVNSPDSTRAVGELLAKQLRRGDLVMLSGGLGAGKTTFTQGIGAGLQVKGRISSPTFIVARVHPSLMGGADLIHADAYRIKDLTDLETLDLDSTLDEAITVIEWGEGKTEQLSGSRLEITINRQQGGSATSDNGVIDLAEMDDGKRDITIRSVGERWQETDWEQVFYQFI